MGLTHVCSSLPIQVFGTLDAKHVGRRFGWHARQFLHHYMFGMISVCVTVTGTYGCPIAALINTDGQSEKQLSHNTNSRYCPGVWDDLGVVVFQFVAKLAYGGWMADGLFSLRQLFANAVAAHHLMGMLVMLAERRFGRRRESFMPPLQTCINTMYTSGHMILRTTNMIPGIPCLANKTTEDKCESHFQR